jgi:hypothetical protein
MVIELTILKFYKKFVSLGDKHRYDFLRVYSMQGIFSSLKYIRKSVWENFDL